jgi:hypothetical protein
MQRKKSVVMKRRNAAVARSESAVIDLVFGLLSFRPVFCFGSHLHECRNNFLFL